MESNILCAHLNRIMYWLNVFVLIISLLFPCINVLFMISDGTCINFTTYIGTEKKVHLLLWVKWSFWIYYFLGYFLSPAAQPQPAGYHMIRSFEILHNG